MPNFDRVTEVELSEIRELRSRRYGRKIPATAPLDDITGLTFSGGGIRSATFCLGALQGLATYGLLKHFDYISTVSGGGYIASWLISWIKRPGKETRNLSGIEFVEEQLRKAPPEFAPDKVEKYEEPGAINFLRSYSNYLTPRLGIFGADTWTAVASYFRNLLLNQAILISSLAAGLLLPWLLQTSFKSSYCMPQVWALILIAFAGALMLLALAFVDLNIADFSLREAIAERDPNEPPSRSDQTAASQKQVLWFAVLPIGAAAVIGALGVWRISSKLNTCWWLWMVWGALGYFLLRFVSLMLAWLWLLRKPKEKGFWKRERAVAQVMLPWAPVARGSMRSASAGINLFVSALEWPRLREAHIRFFRRGLLRCSCVDSDYSADRCIACRIAGSPISQPEKRVVGASGRMAVGMHRHLDTASRDGTLFSFGCAVAIRMAKSQDLDDRRMGGNNGVRSSGG